MWNIWPENTFSLNINQCTPPPPTVFEVCDSLTPAIDLYRYSSFKYLPYHLSKKNPFPKTKQKLQLFYNKLFTAMSCDSSKRPKRFIDPIILTRCNMTVLCNPPDLDLRPRGSGKIYSGSVWTPTHKAKQTIMNINLKRVEYCTCDYSKNC